MKWIKVKDKLPANEGHKDLKRFLIWDRYIGYHELAYWYQGQWISEPDEFYCKEYNPTHWMPLPEPPECSG